MNLQKILASVLIGATLLSICTNIAVVASKQAGPNPEQNQSQNEEKPYSREDAILALKWIQHLLVAFPDKFEAMVQSHFEGQFPSVEDFFQKTTEIFLEIESGHLLLKDLTEVLETILALEPFVGQNIQKNTINDLAGQFLVSLQTINWLSDDSFEKPEHALALIKNFIAKLKDTCVLLPELVTELENATIDMATLEQYWSAHQQNSTSAARQPNLNNLVVEDINVDNANSTINNVNNFNLETNNVRNATRMTNSSINNYGFEEINPGDISAAQQPPLFNRFASRILPPNLNITFPQLTNMLPPACTLQ